MLRMKEIVSECASMQSAVDEESSCCFWSDPVALADCRLCSAGSRSS